MKVRFKNVEYIVRPKEGIVKCCGMVMPQDFHPFIESNHRYELGQIYYRNVVAFHAEGIAKCSPNDTFDENIGKKIANMKMRSSMYKKIHSYFMDTNKFIENLRATNIKFADKVADDYTNTRMCLKGYIEKQCK